MQEVDCTFPCALTLDTTSSVMGMLLSAAARDALPSGWTASLGLTGAAACPVVLQQVQVSRCYSVLELLVTHAVIVIPGYLQDNTL